MIVGAVTRTGAPIAALIVIDSEPESALPTAFVARKTSPDVVAAVVGVPLRTPEDERDRPAGSVPD